MGVVRLNLHPAGKPWAVLARCACALFVGSAWAATLAAQTPAPTDHQPDDASAADAAALADNLPPPSAEQIAQWIQQLGHNAYAVRQMAAERLAAAGSAARDDLTKVVDSPDPEIRAAARRLVALIDESEANRRLAEFAADTDGRRGLALPGWKEFGDLVGQDEAARALFVEMQRHESVLLDAMFGNRSRDGGQLWDERFSRIFNLPPGARPQTAMPSLGSCATMIFLGALPQADVNDMRMNFLANLTRRPPLREAILANHEPNTIRRLVSAWVLNCPNRSETALNERLILLFIYDLNEALPLATRIAHGGPEYLTASPALRATAALAVGRFGSKADVDALEPLLDDETAYPVPNLNQVQGLINPVQVRDVALAILLHLTGQEPKDYGFTRIKTNPQTVFDPTSLGLDNNEQRASAIAKWRAWKAAQTTEPSSPQR
jgi:hypothetical protein